MAGEDEGEERTQEPTAKRQRDFAERGDIAKSTEINGAAGLAAAAIAFLAFAPILGQSISNTFQFAFLRIPDQSGDLNAMMELGRATAFQLLIGLAPILSFLWAAAMFVGLYQQWGAFPKEPFKFDINKFNPYEGFKQKFMSPKPVVELLKGIAKIALVGWLVYTDIKERFAIIPSMAASTPVATMTTLKELALMVLWRALPLAIAIAFFDYLYESYRVHEKMKMTRKEVKDENKDQDGDPLLKQARRKRAQELAFARTVQNVKKADIIITNPDHYAVALRYRKAEAPAPVVVAKGVDRLAQAIKAEGARHDVPQVENRPLARALFARVKEGKTVPADLYDAVARVLAVIWRRRRPQRA